MTSFLLDTNVLSEFSRRDPAPHVRQWLRRAKERSLFTSVLALAEIRQGIELLDPGKRRSALEQWFERELHPSFEARVFPVTQSIADRWARLSARARRGGVSIATIDGLIAATALEHGLTMATRNVRDFSGLGIEIVNPWEVMA